MADRYTLLGYELSAEGAAQVATDVAQGLSDGYRGLEERGEALFAEPPPTPGPKSDADLGAILRYLAEVLANAPVDPQEYLVQRYPERDPGTRREALAVWGRLAGVQPDANGEVSVERCLEGLQDAFADWSKATVPQDQLWHLNFEVGFLLGLSQGHLDNISEEDERAYVALVEDPRTKGEFGTGVLLGILWGFVAQLLTDLRDLIVFLFGVVVLGLSLSVAVFAAFWLSVAVALLVLIATAMTKAVIDARVRQYAFDPSVFQRDLAVAERLLTSTFDHLAAVVPAAVAGQLKALHKSLTYGYQTVMLYATDPEQFLELGKELGYEVGKASADLAESMVRKEHAFFHVGVDFGYIAGQWAWTLLSTLVPGLAAESLLLRAGKGALGVGKAGGRLLRPMGAGAVDAVSKSGLGGWLRRVPQGLPPAGKAAPGLPVGAKALAGPPPLPARKSTIEMPPPPASPQSGLPEDAVPPLRTSGGVQPSSRAVADGAPDAPLGTRDPSRGTAEPLGRGGPDAGDAQGVSVRLTPRTPPVPEYPGLGRRVSQAAPGEAASLFDDVVIPMLTGSWLDEYFRRFPDSEVVEVVDGGSHFLFDVGRGRLISAWRIGDGKNLVPRPASRMQGHPLSPGALVHRAYHRGHAIPHSGGGGVDINLAPQLGRTNVGPFRPLENRFVDTPGSLYFTFWSYSDDIGQTAGAVQQGLLIAGESPDIRQFAN